MTRTVFVDEGTVVVRKADGVTGRIVRRSRAAGDPASAAAGTDQTILTVRLDTGPSLVLTLREFTDAFRVYDRLVPAERPAYRPSPAEVIAKAAAAQIAKETNTEPSHRAADLLPGEPVEVTSWAVTYEDGGGLVLTLNGHDYRVAAGRADLLGAALGRFGADDRIRRYTWNDGKVR